MKPREGTGTVGMPSCITPAGSRWRVTFSGMSVSPLGDDLATLVREVVCDSDPNHYRPGFTPTGTDAGASLNRAAAARASATCGCSAASAFPHRLTNSS